MLQHQTAEDINHKYAKSLVMYKGDPVMCQGAINERGKLQFVYTLVCQKEFVPDQKMVPADDPLLTDGPFHLGYVNGIKTPNADGEIVDVCVFTSRAPIRRWKQGLTNENMVFVPGLLNFNAALKMPQFADMIRGKYPTIKQAAGKLGEKVARIAYHRRWALGLSKLEEVELYYRGQIVGRGEDEKQIVLAPKFAFLKEAFELSKE